MPPLIAMLSSTNERDRLHAAWTLHNMAKLEDSHLAAAKKAVPALHKSLWEFEEGAEDDGWAHGVEAALRAIGREHSLEFVQRCGAADGVAEGGA